MDVDPLNELTGDYATPVTLPRWQDCEPDLFFDGGRFLHYISTYPQVDVMTYSLSKDNLVLKNIGRLIYGLKERGRSMKCVERRFVLNNHIKLFICYTHLERADVFLGSQNLTHGTNLNIMYRVRQEHVQPLVDLFEFLWKRAKQLPSLPVNPLSAVVTPSK